MLADHWVGVLDQGDEITDPDMTKIEQAIRALDGSERTLVLLKTDGVAHMGIGGGTANVYFVYVTFDDVEFLAPTIPVTEPGTMVMNIGGQEGEYSKEHCVDLAVALSAARAFAASGILEPSINWRVV